MLTEDSRKDILNSVLESIKTISDIEYQRRVWIRGAGPECDDFDESVNNYSPHAEGILEHYKDFRVTEIQFQILKKFDERFRKFWDENYWPPEFIDTPEWTKIMEMAKETLKAFNYAQIPK